tara:strand:- start:309 stop:2954 length:2646 start_codon:yes stop_codon:yes gene_type:complete
MANGEKSEREKLLERIPAPDRRSEPRPEVPGAEPGFMTALGAGIVPFYGKAPDENSSVWYRQGHMVGESILFGLPMAKGATYVPKVAETANKGIKIANNIIQAIGNSYKTRGWSGTALTEGMMGLGAGTAGHYAVQNFPDSGIAQFVAELGGGLATDMTAQASRGIVKGALSLAPSVQVGRFVGDKWANFRRKTSPFHARTRTRERLERQGITEPVANRIIDESDIQTLTESGEFLPGAVDQMSFATRSGNAGLLQLEKDVMAAATEDALSLGTTQRLQELNDIVTQGFDFGDTASLRQHMEVKDEYYKALFDASMEDVAHDINSRLSRNAVTAGDELQANLIARSSLDRALKSARQTETAKWKDIPPDIKFNTDSFAKLWQELKSGMTNVTRQTDTPITASWLNKIQFGKLKGQPRVGQTVTIQQARDVISKLREEARNATSAFGDTNFNLARIANDLATKLNDDLSASIEGLVGSPHGPGDEILATMQDAVLFSKNLNEQFRNPAIAGLFARDATGARVIRDTEVLDHLFSGPSKNRGNYDELMAAVGNDPAVETALSDYLKFSLFNQGNFDLPAAENFLKVNERLLDRMPALRNEVIQAVETSDIGRLKEGVLKRDFDPLLAATTIFIKKEPIRAIAEVLDSVNPTRSMAEILKLTREDASGAATQGLQQSFSDYLLNQATSKSSFASTGGNRFVNYNVLAETIRKPSVEALIPMVFDAPQQRRLEQISASARRMQLYRDAPQTTEDIQQDLASKLLSVAARISGARIGGGPISGASMGGSLQTASVISGWLQEMVKGGIENPSQELIKMAVLDEEIFKALYRTPKNAEGAKAAEETISTAVRYLIRGAGSKAASTETLLVEPFTEERDRRSGAIQNQ